MMASELRAALADFERKMTAEYDRLRGEADTATEIANRCSLAANKAEARVAELEAALDPDTMNDIEPHSANAAATGTGASRVGSGSASARYSARGPAMASEPRVGWAPYVYDAVDEAPACPGNVDHVIAFPSERARDEAARALAKWDDIVMALQRDRRRALELETALAGVIEYAEAFGRVRGLEAARPHVGGCSPMATGCDGACAEHGWWAKACGYARALLSKGGK